MPVLHTVIRVAPPPTSDKNGFRSVLILIIIIAVAIMTLLACQLYTGRRRRRRQHQLFARNPSRLRSVCRSEPSTSCNITSSARDAWLRGLHAPALARPAPAAVQVHQACGRADCRRHRMPEILRVRIHSSSDSPCECEPDARRFRIPLPTRDTDDGRLTRHKSVLSWVTGSSERSSIDADVPGCNSLWSGPSMYSSASESSTIDSDADDRTPNANRRRRHKLDAGPSTGSPRPVFFLKPKSRMRSTSRPATRDPSRSLSPGSNPLIPRTSPLSTAPVIGSKTDLASQTHHGVDTSMQASCTRKQSRSPRHQDNIDSRALSSRQLSRSSNEALSEDHATCATRDCDSECPICLEPISRGVIATACHHRFHSSCLEWWRVKSDNVICPLCPSSFSAGIAR